MYPAEQQVPEVDACDALPRGSGPHRRRRPAAAGTARQRGPRPNGALAPSEGAAASMSFLFFRGPMAARALLLLHLEGQAGEEEEEEEERLGTHPETQRESMVTPEPCWSSCSKKRNWARTSPLASRLSSSCDAEDQSRAVPEEREEADNRDDGKTMDNEKKKAIGTAVARKASSLQECVTAPTSSELVARIRALSSVRLTPAMEVTSLMSSSSLHTKHTSPPLGVWFLGIMTGDVATATCGRIATGCG
ncbi:hypothetical protein CRUP_007701 [Coryphaenoides rupestris]|nr:hypothetical protein CRUP_007701 [Coryphaenoides rupestris]